MKNRFIKHTLIILITFLLSTHTMNAMDNDTLPSSTHSTPPAVLIIPPALNMDRKSADNQNPDNVPLEPDYTQKIH